MGGDLSDPFDVETGLKQGCPLSCRLFSLILEYVMRQTPLVGEEIRLTFGTICDRLAYADDVDFVGEDIVERDNQIVHFRRSAKRIGLKINEDKTKVMKVSRAGRQLDYIEHGGLNLEVVDQFKYLGSMVTSRNDIKEEVKIRITSAAKCSWSIRELLKVETDIQRHQDLSL